MAYSSDSNIRVEINVYADGELAMSYGMTDAWPMVDRTAVERIVDAGKAVYNQFRKSF